MVPTEAPIGRRPEIQPTKRLPKKVTILLFSALGLLLIAIPLYFSVPAHSQTDHEGHGALDSKSNQAAHEGHNQRPQQKPQYQCPMHPFYTSDRPGSCPICGMTLVPMKEPGAPETPIVGRVTVAAPESKLELSGVRFGTVDKRSFTKTIRAAGRVEYNERLLSTFNVKFAGWVERLYVSAVGDVVQKDAPLFEIYSPDLMEAERSYLLAYRAALEGHKVPSSDGSTFAEQNLGSARERLLLWDITEEQIRELETRKEPSTRVVIRSKVSGIVTRRNITLGNYVTPGTELYALADLSSVWVRAEIYQVEIPLLKTGLGAKITFAGLPGDPLEGQVSYLYPSLNEQARTLEIRIEAPNPAHALKPGMFVTATIEVALGPKLVIDEQAVLESGLRHLVFVEAHPGHLVPREVMIGARENGWVVVERGLSEGERIVTSGTFLVDSESRLRAALLGSGPEGQGGHRH